MGATAAGSELGSCHRTTAYPQEQALQIQTPHIPHASEEAWTLPQCTRQPASSFVRTETRKEIQKLISKDQGQTSRTGVTHMATLWSFYRLSPEKCPLVFRNRCSFSYVCSHLAQGLHNQSLRFFFLKLELKKHTASGRMGEEGGVEVASLEIFRRY